MADLPGGASGLRVRGYKGKEADRLVTHIDPGAVSLIAELRGHERQAAQELGQWKTHTEEPEPPDASPAAINLALLLTDEELDCRTTCINRISWRSHPPIIVLYEPDRE